MLSSLLIVPGSAVYVFALMPLFQQQTNATPTFVNLTFTMDSQRGSQFVHQGSEPPPTDGSSDSPTAYQSNVLVYNRSELPEGFHSLRIDVGTDSVFLLDYITYSQDDGFANGGNSTENDVSSTLAGATPTGTPGAGSGRPSASANRCV